MGRWFEPSLGSQIHLSKIMFYYTVKIQTTDNQVLVVNGYQQNGKLTKKTAEQIAREELSDPKHCSATVYNSTGKKIYSR